jgi:hypothetical protein
VSEWLRQRRNGGVNRLAALFAPAARTDPQARRAMAGRARAPVWRCDLERVGSDADFNGWVRKFRLADPAAALGRHWDGRFATGVIHLWHREADRAQLAANDALPCVIGSQYPAQRLSVLRDENEEATARRAWPPK